MTCYQSLLGTWAYDGDPDPTEWWNPQSPFSMYLAERGFTYLQPEDPFLWDGKIGGLWGDSKHLVWQAAATQLAFRLKQVPYHQRNVIAHSHGANVAAYCATRVRINRLVTVAMPVRKDMRSVYELARKNTSGWRHIYATGWSDKMQLLGQLFDGSWSFERRVLIAGVNNVGIPGGVGHSRLLNDPTTFHWWEESGTLAFLSEFGIAGV